jgi:4-hydroxy-2-oxoglutarate aldolase
LYNFSGTGVNLLPATVARLAEHPNIIGMKESGSDISQIADLVASTPQTFSVLAGSGSTFFPPFALASLVAFWPCACCRAMRPTL